MLNQLLGLELYKDITQEFFNEKFNTTHFPSLLEKLDWDYDGALKGLTSPVFYMELKALGGLFALDVSHNLHAYVSAISYIKIEEYQKTMFNLAHTQLAETPSQYVANLVCLYAYGTIDIVLYKKYPYLKQFAFYLQDLFNPNVAVSMINDLINQKKPLYNFIAALLDFLPIRADLYYQKQVIEKIIQTKVLDDKDVKIALDIIMEKIEQTEVNINDKIEFITHVIDIYPNQAINIAKESIININYLIRSNALKLLIELVKNGYGYNEAIKMTVKLVKDSNSKMRWGTLTLLIELVKKEQGYEQAIAAAVELVEDKDSHVYNEAFKLFKELIKKEQGYNEAVKAALVYIKNKDDQTRIRLALEMLTELVIKEKKEWYKDAIHAASSKNIDYQNIYTTLAMFNLFTELIKKEQGYNEAIEAVLIGIKDENKFIRDEALELKKLLQEKDVWPKEE